MKHRKHNLVRITNDGTIAIEIGDLFIYFAALPYHSYSVVYWNLKELIDFSPIRIENFFKLDINRNGEIYLKIASIEIDAVATIKYDRYVYKSGWFDVHIAGKLLLKLGRRHGNFIYPGLVMAKFYAGKSMREIARFYGCDISVIEDAIRQTLNTGKKK